MLKQYFSRIEKPNRLPSILLSIVGAICLIYANLFGLHLVRGINSIISLFGSYDLTGFEKILESTLKSFGILLISFAVLRLSEIKFPGLFKGVCWMVFGIVILIYSPIIEDNINRLFRMLAQKEFMETNSAFSHYHDFFWRVSGPFIVSIGALRIAIALFRIIPSDNIVDKWFQERLERIWIGSLSKLNLTESDLITPVDKRFKLVTMSRFLLDEPPNKEVKKKGGLRCYIQKIIDAISYWRSALYIENEDFDYDPADWGVHLGFDNHWRFSCYVVFFVHLTKDFVAFYKCEYNFIRDRIMVEMTARHFYEDVVGVEKSDFIANKKLIANVITTKDQELKILLRGSENIRIYAPLTIVYDRRGLDKFLKGRRKRQRLSTEMDIMEKNIHAYVVDRKHPLEDHTATTNS